MNKPKYPPRLTHISGGLALFTLEEPQYEVEGSWLVFDAAKTLFVKIGDNGAIGISKVDDWVGHPKTFRVPTRHVVAVTDISDERFETTLRAARAGIVTPPARGDVARN